ncbi:unnamed protein product [Owenia fusiformis]|uniref:adenylate cyclase n=1 Tax=Owenia fusiformis TaxID=6347 RepID=A0A8J1UTW4_OWEFU|nr:unnamed protein product [Owenia fusiformis]
MPKKVSLAKKGRKSSNLFKRSNTYDLETCGTYNEGYDGPHSPTLSTTNETILGTGTGTFRRIGDSYIDLPTIGQSNDSDEKTKESSHVIIRDSVTDAGVTTSLNRPNNSPPYSPKDEVSLNDICVNFSISPQPQEISEDIHVKPIVQCMKIASSLDHNQSEKLFSPQEHEKTVELSSLSDHVRSLELSSASEHKKSVRLPSSSKQKQSDHKQTVDLQSSSKHIEMLSSTDHEQYKDDQKSAPSSNNEICKNVPKPNQRIENDPGANRDLIPECCNKPEIHKANSLTHSVESEKSHTSEQQSQSSDKSEICNEPHNKNIAFLTPSNISNQTESNVDKDEAIKCDDVVLHESSPGDTERLKRDSISENVPKKTSKRISFGGTEYINMDHEETSIQRDLHINANVHIETSTNNNVPDITKLNGNTPSTKNGGTTFLKNGSLRNGSLPRQQHEYKSREEIQEMFPAIALRKKKKQRRKVAVAEIDQPDLVASRPEISAPQSLTLSSRRVSFAADPDREQPTSENDIDEENPKPPRRRRSMRRRSKWSLQYIKDRFEDNEIEDLYKRYSLRIQRDTLIALLVILVFYGVSQILLINTVGMEDSAASRESAPGTNIVMGVGIGGSLVGIALVSIKPVFVKFNKLIALFIWLFLMTTVYIFFTFQTDKQSFDDVPMIFYMIFIIHTMMPMNRKWALILGSLTGVLDLLVQGILLHVTENFIVFLTANQLVCNGLIFVCANLVGLYHKYLTDLAHRQTFLDTRDFIEANIKFSRRREKQNKMREGLLHKIIPKYLVEDIKQLLLKRLVQSEPDATGFYDLMIQRHEQVSILYADIVNFTPLTNELSPYDLVNALNELFGRFDQLAKEHNCMRIKILGDCYYCVSGLPDPIPTHARNCVRMGLEMIKVIREIRHKTGVWTLDMRIGVHSGTVLCGVLGLRKWQYDVWSDDVTIANHMESSGEAGKVHITKATLKELGKEGEEFVWNEAHGQERDTVLKENNIETYFIQPKSESADDVNDNTDVAKGRPKRPLARRFSVYVENWGAEKPFVSLSDYMMEKTMPLYVYGQEIGEEEEAEVKKRLERAFHLEENDDIHDYKDWIKLESDEISAVTLLFKNTETENQYSNLPDPLFKYYIVCASIIYACVVLIQFMIFNTSVLQVCVFSVGILLFLAMSVFGMAADISCLRRTFFSRASGNITRSKWAKILISFTTIIYLFTSANIIAFECKDVHDDPYNCTNQTVQLFREMVEILADEGVCVFAPYFMYSSMLALTACSVFLRLNWLIKIAYMVLGLLSYNSLFHIVLAHVFDFYDECLGPDILQLRVRGSFYLTVMFVTLIVLDRQTERNSRLDFLWQTKIEQEKDELERSEMLNTMLLENILPRHVAEHFCSPELGKGSVYHRHCKNVCVMFASIPNYIHYFSTVAGTQESLRLLNEIISDFDKLLALKRFRQVEKIKTIGSTYMAATGLSPGENLREENDDLTSSENTILMAMFASEMMSKLADLSNDVLFEYKLRIGICHGDLIAGVVGASKPQYDIWGDTVNVASRMDTYGVIGRIQMPEATANILMKKKISCEFRDTISVKGKGKMKTYLLSDTIRMDTANDSVRSDVYFQYFA